MNAIQGVFASSPGSIEAWFDYAGPNPDPVHGSSDAGIFGMVTKMYSTLDPVCTPSQLLITVTLNGTFIDQGASSAAVITVSFVWILYFSVSHLFSHFHSLTFVVCSYSFIHSFLP